MRITHDDRMRRMTATLPPALEAQRLTRSKINRAGAITPKSMLLRNWPGQDRRRKQAAGAMRDMRRLEAALRDPTALAAAAEPADEAR